MTPTRRLAKIAAAEANVLYAARRYVFHGSKGATAERMRLFKYWERRLRASAVKLGISEGRRK